SSSAIYTLSLHDALPIYLRDFTAGQCVEWIMDQVKEGALAGQARHLVLHFRFEVGSTELFEKLEKFYLEFQALYVPLFDQLSKEDRKSTRLNSSHVKISY